MPRESYTYLVNKPDPPAAEWFDDPSRGGGLRFECTQCGACCTGPTGVVRFSEDEGRAIAAHLGQTWDQFLSRFTRDTPMGRSFREVRTEHGFDCIFLDRRRVPGKAVCGLYDRRPTQCRTFPWWPEHLDDERAWRSLARHCEGVGRGSVVPASEIRIERARQEAARGL